MKKVVLLAAGVASLALAVPAQAATFLTVQNSSPAACTTATPVCNFDVDGEVDIDGVFSLLSNQFFIPSFGESTGSLTNSRASITASTGTNIDFNDVYIRSVDNPSDIYFFGISNGDVVSRGTLDTFVTGGFYELVINGTAQTFAGPPASFPRIGGDLTFVAAAAVPEPATWAMFILGFGVLGYGLRRRNAQASITKARLHFA